MTSHTPTWDYSDPATGLSLPATYFFDKGVFDAEKQAIFMRCWHLVGHVNEFRDPGSYVCQDIFEQSVIVEIGRAHV